MSSDFDRILHECQSPIRAYIAGRGVAPTTVDDIAQEVFLAFHREQQRMPAEVEPLAWLKGIARNLCNNHFRGESRRGRLIAAIADHLEQLPAPDQEPDDNDRMVKQLRCCLDRLQPHVREAICTYYAEDCSATELAQRLDMGPSGLRMLIHRAREQLRRCLAAGT